MGSRPKAVPWRSRANSWDASLHARRPGLTLRRRRCCFCYRCSCYRCLFAATAAGWPAVTPHSYSALGQSTLLCPQSKRLCPGLFCLLRLAQPLVVFPSSQRHDTQSLPPRRTTKLGLTDPVTPVKPHVLEILLVFASLINYTFSTCLSPSTHPSFIASFMYPLTNLYRFCELPVW